MITHVAMIMDGNGRWAKARGLPRLAGHQAGADTVRFVLNYAKAHDIRYVTLYAFSIENWTRPTEEVQGLMQLLGTFLTNEEHTLHENQCRLRIMGRKADLSPELQVQLNRIEAETAQYERQVIVALSYGAQTEIAEAAQKIAREVQQGKLAPEAIDTKTFAQYLYLPDVPPPDLIIRTSGEMRLSNFMLWQAAYAELYVTPVLWPDFREEAFDAALASFAKRDRRYGGVK